MNTASKFSLPLVLGGIVLFLSACGIITTPVGATQTKTEVVASEGADQVEVDIMMGLGELNVSGGSDALMNGEFIFNVADWEPEIKYEVSGGEGHLTVEQPGADFEGIPDGDLEYQWDIELNDEVPLELDVALGAGESHLDLRGLQLERLSVETGAGSSEILLGDSPLGNASISAGVGELTVDLSGNWTKDANVSLDAGVGEMTLIVPEAVGVIINAELGLGDLTANGFGRENGAYVNDAYGSSPVTINVNLDGGVGDVTLRLAN